MKRRNVLRMIAGFLVGTFFPRPLLANNEPQLEWLPKTDAQKFMLDKFNNNRTMMISSPRQMGKSVICTAYALEVVASRPHANILWLTPNISMARLAIEKFRDMAVHKLLRTPHGNVPLDVPNVTVTHDNKFSMVFKNGSTILFERGDEDSACSREIDLIIYEETAFISNMKNVWRTCQPTTSTPSSKTIMISTPEKGSWFNEKFLDKNFDVPKFNVNPGDIGFGDMGAGNTLSPYRRDQEYLGKVF